nr:glycosyltransferase family 2 protein [uncultured Flavobacterium sp.]
MDKIKTKNQIKFSIVIAVYNGERYIQETINSIKNQTYQNYEVILIDGNSKDSTMEIVLKNKAFFSKIVSEADSGMYDAINKGFSFAKGTHYCYINADDILKSYALEKVAEVFKKNKSDLVFGDVEYIDEKSQFIYAMKGKKLSKKGVSYIRRVPFAQQSSFWSSEIYKKLGGFDATLKYVADSKFLLNLYLDPNAKIKYISKVLGVYRLHSDSFSVGSLSKMKIESKFMLTSLDSLKTNKFLKLYYEFLTKIINIGGIYKRKTYNGPKF